MDDYKTLLIHGAKSETAGLRVADKGHLQELKAFGEAIKSGGEWPILLWQQLQAMETAFAVQENMIAD